MRIFVIAVGRMRSRPESALFEHYRRQITWTVDLKEVEERRARAPDERRRREASLLLASIPRRAAVVALDGSGRSVDSDTFARCLGAWQDEGVADLAFLIGGAEGLDPSVTNASDLILSLGPMTWPHLLTRAMLIEQIYRAQSILTGHPYHRA